MEQELPKRQSVAHSPWTYLVIFIVLAMSFGGFNFIRNFTENDYARDKARVEEKLNLISASSAENLQKFLVENFTSLRILADNPSLKLYMTELVPPADNAAKDDKVEVRNEASAAKSYLRNLLIFTAQRGGFIGKIGRASCRERV